MLALVIPGLAAGLGVAIGIISTCGGPAEAVLGSIVGASLGALVGACVMATRPGPRP